MPTSQRLTSRRGQRGQLLMIVMVLGMFATLVVSALLVYASTSVSARAKDTLHIQERYSAAAGVEAVVSDLLKGVNPLGVGYTPPAPAINGLTASVTVAAGVGAPPPASSAVTGGIGCSLTISGVTAYADYLVTSQAGGTTLKAYVRQCPGPLFAGLQQYVTVQSLNEG